MPKRFAAYTLHDVMVFSAKNSAPPAATDLQDIVLTYEMQNGAKTPLILSSRQPTIQACLQAAARWQYWLPRDARRAGLGTRRHALAWCRRPSHFQVLRSPRGAWTVASWINLSAAVSPESASSLCRPIRCGRHEHWKLVSCCL